MEEVKLLHPLLHHKTPEQIYNELKEPLPFSEAKVNLTVPVTERAIKNLDFYEWKNFFALFPVKDVQIGVWKTNSSVDMYKIIEFNSNQSLLVDCIVRNPDVIKDIVRSLSIESFQGEHKAIFYDFYNNVLENVIRYGSFALFLSLFVHLYETNNPDINSVFEKNVERYITLSCLYQNINVFYVVASYNKTKAFTINNFFYTFVLPSQSTEFIDCFINQLLQRRLEKAIASSISLCCHNKAWKKISYIKEILVKNNLWNFSEQEVRTVLLSAFPDRKNQVWICVALDLSSPST